MLKDFEITEKLGIYKHWLKTHKILGEGAYSSVYKVRRLSDDQIYALKKVKLKNLSEAERLNALNEVRIIASIRHPNIINFKESFFYKETDYLW